MENSNVLILIHFRFITKDCHFCQQETAANRTHFYAKLLKAMHIDILPPIVRGFVAPSQNVATIDQCLVTGCENREMLLDGNTQPANHCTYHSLNPGCAITIQLNQPYYIGSLRLRLWDLDDRSYRFYIETSFDYTGWNEVFDSTYADVKSWKTITFEPRVVSYIRIVGTSSSDNKRRLLEVCLQRTLLHSWNLLFII